MFIGQFFPTHQPVQSCLLTSGQFQNRTDLFLQKTGSQSDSKSFLATKMHVSDQDDVCSERNIYPLFVLKWQTVRISCSLLLDENLFLFGHWGKNRPEYLCIVIFLFCILAKATVQNLIFKTLEYWSTYYSEYSPQKHVSSCSQLPPVTSIFFCPFLKVVL